MLKRPSDAPLLRALVLAGVVAAPLVFARHALDEFNAAKLTVVLVLAVMALAIAVASAVQQRRIAIPWQPAAGFAALFVLLLVVGVINEGQWSGWWGEESRANGALLYLGCFVAFVATVRAFDVARVHWLARATGAVAAVTAIYGALQLMGVEPLGWDTPYRAIVGTLGNPNYVSALLGIAVPIALASALGTERDARLRIAWAVVAAAAFTVAAASVSVQGPIAAIAGSIIVVAVWLVERGRVAARVALGGVVALGLVGSGTVIAGLAGIGPLAGLSTTAAIGPRLVYWDTALSMARAHPISGVGIGAYGAHYREFRAPEASVEFSATLVADTAHSVPLDLLAGGGIPVAAAYVVFLIAVLATALRGLTRHEGSRRLALAGFTGAWLAYQAQSVVSIDVPPLALWHWVLAGAVVVLASEVRFATIGGGRGATTSRRSRGGRRRGQASSPAGWIAGIVGVVIALAGVWAATIPLRAHLSAQEGLGRLQAGDGSGGDEALAHATGLLGGEAWFWQEWGDAHARRGDLDTALGKHQEALARDPRRYTSLLSSARIAEELGEVALADEMWEHLTRIEPAHPALIAEATEYWLRRDHPERAEALLERSARSGVMSPELEELSTELP